MRPIVLSAKRGRFRQEDQEAESSDVAFAEVRQRVLVRDQWTCHHCDFQADKWQDVHHRDDNHRNNDPENLVTACKLCHACHHIGLASMDGGGIMIYLPEIPQEYLNRLVRGMFVAGRLGSAEWRQDASELWKFLLSRREPIMEAFGTDDPVVFANAMISSSVEDYDNRMLTMGELRFLIKPKSRMLALPNGSSVIDYWASHVYNKVPDSAWMDLADQVYRVVA